MKSIILHEKKTNQEIVVVLNQFITEWCDEKSYTLVSWEDENGEKKQAYVKETLKDIGNLMGAPFASISKL